MPVFNGVETVSRAAQSVLNQTLRDFELVVSDNASTDGTADVLDSVSADARVRVVRQPRTVPIMVNFGCVLQEARGEYFMWAAADDEWDPAFLETMVHILDDDPTCGVAMSSIELVDPAGARIGTVMYTGPDAPDSLSKRQLYRRITKVHPGASLHYFIYGLFRTDLLCTLLRQPLNSVTAGDRIFMSEVCLVTRLRATPAILHRRTLASKTLIERYPDDPMVQSSADSTWRWVYARALLSRAWRSPHVSVLTKLSVVLPTWIHIAVGQLRASIRERRRTRVA